MNDKTWSITVPETEDFDGYIVPLDIVDQLASAFVLQQDNLFRRYFIRPKTWEERLTDAVRERSMRMRWRRAKNRLRAARREAADRLSLAADALLGRHVCDGDDW